MSLIPAWKERKAMTSHGNSVDTDAAYNKALQKATSSLERKRLHSRVWISFRLILIAAALLAISALASNEILKDIFVNLTATFIAAAFLFFFLDDIWRRSHESFTNVMETADYVARLTTLFEKVSAKTLQIKKQQSELKQVLDLVITQKYEYQLSSLETLEERIQELTTELGTLTSETNQYLKNLTTLLENPPLRHIELIEVIAVSIKRLRDVSILISHTIDENVRLMVASREEYVRVNKEYMEQNPALNSKQIEAMSQALENLTFIQQKFKDDMDKLQRKRDESEKELHQIQI